jgi:Cu-Zn family superoxide dismutase
MRKAMLLGVAVVLLAGSAAAKKLTVTTELKDAKGQSVGTAKISGGVGSGDHGVTIKLRLHGLEPGEHALHFHQNAVCEAPEFKSAGPHFNPAKMKHGLRNPAGPHAGDLPNFKADAKGNAKATLHDERVSLGEREDSLFSNGGTALVVHAKADDMKTDPAGNAGDRIACGVIKK